MYESFLQQTLIISLVIILFSVLAFITMLCLMICLLTEEILGYHINKIVVFRGSILLVAVCTSKLQLLYSVVLE